MFSEDAGHGVAWRAQRRSDKEFQLALRKTIMDRLHRRLRRRLSGVDLRYEGCCNSLLCFGEEGNAKAINRGEVTLARMEEGES